MPDREQALPTGAAFLLTQVGTHAARRFGERVSDLGVTPPQIGVLRSISTAPGRSQQQIASELGVRPARLVALLDELTEKGLIERRPNESDRRLHAVHLSTQGARFMRERATPLAVSHERDILKALSEQERSQLSALLQRVAADQGLTPGVHPGFGRLGEKPEGP